MRFYWPAIFTIVALLGLGTLQWQWLQAALQLEENEVGQSVERALWQVDRQLRTDRAASFGVLSLQRYRQRGEEAPDTLQSAVWVRLDSISKPIMARNGLRRPYRLEVLTGNTAVSLMPGVGSRLAEGKQQTYVHEIRGQLPAACDCRLYLQLTISEIPLPLLFGRIWKVLVPAIIFFLLLAVGFALLWRGISREQKLSQMKNDFINHLTHEMKTPVFSISLLSKLLRRQLEEGQPAEAGRYLDRIESQTQQLKEQVEQILELASLEQPEYQLRLQQLELDALAPEWVAPFAQRLEEEGGELQLQAQRGLQLRADPDHLGNALQNLLDNAVKYGGDPAVVFVRIKVEGSELVIEVEDNGQGIPQADQGRVFEKFYRVKRNASQRAGGFGLGLSYSRQVIQLHGGVLRLVASGPEGTTFEIRLPK